MRLNFCELNTTNEFTFFKDQFPRLIALARPELVICTGFEVITLLALFTLNVLINRDIETGAITVEKTPFASSQKFRIF